MKTNSHMYFFLLLLTLGLRLFTGSIRPNKQTETITLVIAVAIIFIMALLGTAILTVLLIKRRKLKCLHRMKTNSQSREPPTR